MGELTAVYIIWLREMKKFVRNKSRIAGSMMMPFMFLVFLGTGLRGVVDIPGLPAGATYIDFLAPGIVGMALLFSSMFAGLSMLWDRQFGFLKEIMVAPVRRTAIVVGRIFAGMTTGVFQAFFILAVSVLLGVKIASAFGLLASVAFIFLIAMSFVGVGISFASRMEDMHGFQLVMNFLIMPTFLLSGALFPLEALPSWLAALSYINPLTYGVDGLRGLITGVSHLPVLVDFGVLAGFCVGVIALARYLFGKTEV